VLSALPHLKANLAAAQELPANPGESTWSET